MGKSSISSFAWLRIYLTGAAMLLAYLTTYPQFTELLVKTIL